MTQQEFEEYDQAFSGAATPGLSGPGQSGAQSAGVYTPRYDEENPYGQSGDYGYDAQAYGATGGEGTYVLPGADGTPAADATHSMLNRDGTPATILPGNALILPTPENYVMDNPTALPCMRKNEKCARCCEHNRFCRCCGSIPFVRGIQLMGMKWRTFCMIVAAILTFCVLAGHVLVMMSANQSAGAAATFGLAKGKAGWDLVIPSDWCDKFYIGIGGFGNETRNGNTQYYTKYTSNNCNDVFGSDACEACDSAGAWVYTYMILGLITVLPCFCTDLHRIFQYYDMNCSKCIAVCFHSLGIVCCVVPFLDWPKNCYDKLPLSGTHAFHQVDLEFFWEQAFSSWVLLGLVIIRPIPLALHLFVPTPDWTHHAPKAVETLTKDQVSITQEARRRRSTMQNVEAMMSNFGAAPSQRTDYTLRSTVRSTARNDTVRSDVSGPQDAYGYMAQDTAAYGDAGTARSEGYGEPIPDSGRQTYGDLISSRGAAGGAYEEHYPQPPASGTRRQDGGTVPRSDGGTVPRSDMGTVPRSDMGTVPRSDMGTVPRSDMGTVPRSDMGTVPRGGGMGTVPRDDAFGTVPRGDAFGTVPSEGAGGSLGLGDFVDPFADEAAGEAGETIDVTMGQLVQDQVGVATQPAQGRNPALTATRPAPKPGASVTMMMD
jgi:hypothetical protein